MTFLSHTPAAIATRFANVANRWVGDGPAERADAARRKLLAAIGEREPATLNQVAKTVGRGAPAVSRSVDSLVRSGLVERQPDPGNRRRLALRLTEQGRELLGRSPASNALLRSKLERLAHSELRAVERAIEILERGL
jgi:DNA-binding MarR family transcriptional regulator